MYAKLYLILNFGETSKTETCHSIFCNWQKIVMSNGLIWIQKYCVMITHKNWKLSYSTKFYRTIFLRRFSPSLNRCETEEIPELHSSSSWNVATNCVWHDNDSILGQVIAVVRCFSGRRTNSSLTSLLKWDGESVWNTGVWVIER